METQLNSDKINRTIERLTNRIQERFPNSGLHRISCELHRLGIKAGTESGLIDRPIMWIRVCVALLVAIILVTIAAAVFAFAHRLRGLSEVNIAEWIALLESGTNELVFIGLVILFLVGLERRVKRNRALKAIHELRAVAHVIDMHQLTKDPSRYNTSMANTKSSPERTLTIDQLTRYLNYCSELLSLNGKIAALYIQRFDDAIALASASEVETLVTGLCQKIWQKIIIAEDISDNQESSLEGPSKAPIVCVSLKRLT